MQVVFFLRFGELGVIYVFQAQFLFSFWFLFSHQTCCLKSSVKAQLSQKSNTLLVPAHWAWLWSPVLCTESFCKPLCSPHQPQFLNFILFVTWPLSFLFLFPSEGILVLISLIFGFPWMYMRGSQNRATPKLWTFKKEKGKVLFISWPFVFISSTNKYRLCKPAAAYPGSLTSSLPKIGRRSSHFNENLVENLHSQ